MPPFFPPLIADIPVEFFIFAAVLIGVALFAKRDLEIAVAGLLIILMYKLSVTNLNLAHHLAGQWQLLLNLFGLLLGFTILAKHFEDSHFPEILPRWLPNNWLGGFMLLALITVLSTFLDNIAAALIGAVMAKKLFKGRVGIGYLVGIVAASNAGGAGSVIGDTTTTMLWIAGVPALHVADAFLGAAVALVFFGIIASRAQHKLQPIQKNIAADVRVDGGRLFIVILIIGGALLGNLLLDFPALGVWLGILLGALIRPTAWHETTKALRSSFFLLALTLSSSLMPVQNLPPPSWHTTFGLGLVSAVFNNIPLTALALFQGGYDWGMLAFAVGYGGSIIWFGSSAGVALCGIFPEAKNTWRWLKEGWHVAAAYVLGFFAMLWILGWHPDAVTGL